MPAGAKASIILRMRGRRPLRGYDDASLWEVFSSQARYEEMDIKEELKVEKAAEAYLKARNTGRCVRQNQVWAHPTSLPPVQIFTPYIVQVLSQYHMDMALCTNARQLA